MIGCRASAPVFFIKFRIAYSEAILWERQGFIEPGPIFNGEKYIELSAFKLFNIICNSFTIITCNHDYKFCKPI